MRTAEEIVAATRSRTLSCVEVTRAALERIADGAALGAWVTVGREQALAAAGELDRAGPGDRPLFGVPVGVKDVFDTADLPTGYGSEAYAGHRPARDAAAVAALRRAGAVIVGKTVSTEFAVLGPTRVGNPLAPGLTPGGSSSGSAAAVAAGMVPVALGTQTAGSVIRPAAYCGIVGYKPTFGAIGRDGVLPVSESLDTVGVLSRTVGDALLVARVLAADGDVSEPTVRRTLPLDLGAVAPDGADGASAPPRLGFAPTPDWERLEPAARDAISAALEAIAARAGAPPVTVELPPSFAALIEAQRLIQLVETAHALRRDRAVLSDDLGAAVDAGLATSAGAYWAAREAVADAAGACRAAVAGLDAVLTPATLGVPPALPSTGDPQLCRAWTALGWPCVAVPVAFASGGLPVGLQVVAPRGADAALLRAAAWLDRGGRG